MQIDSVGDVVLPLVQVRGINFRNNGTPTISYAGTNALNLWFLSSSNGQIFRVFLDKQTSKTIRVVQTQLKGLPFSFNNLNITNRPENNFLSLPIQVNERFRVKAYSVASNGKIGKESWFLSPVLSSNCNPQSFNCKGEVVANGQLVYWIDVNANNPGGVELFVRPLGARGKPIREPVFIDAINSPFFVQSRITYADSTELLPGNKRFLVYIRRHPVGFAFYKPYKLMLQKIDGRTGKKIGKAIELHRDESIPANVKIDPSGRFVLFSIGEGESGSGLNGLAYLAIDSNGRAIGRPQKISDRSGMIDILKDR
jgi:hypothetical protein